MVMCRGGQYHGINMQKKQLRRLTVRRTGRVDETFQTQKDLS